MEKKSKTFCCQSDSTFTNSPNLEQSYKKTSKNLQSMMLQRGNKFKKGNRKRSTFKDKELNEFIYYVKTYRKTLNNKILKHRSYYSDRIKNLPGNGRKQWSKESMQSIKTSLSNLKFVLTGFHPVWYQMLQKNPSLVLILRVCRVILIPTWKNSRWCEFPNSEQEDSLQHE
jgi:hypothetical protein